MSLITDSCSRLPNVSRIHLIGVIQISTSHSLFPFFTNSWNVSSKDCRRFDERHFEIKCMARVCDGRQFLSLRRFGSPTPPSPTASEDTRGVIPKFKTEVRQGEVLFNDPILLEFRQLRNISYFATLQLTQKSLCCVAESMLPPNTSKNNSVAPCCIAG